jgi:hypothetical protein
MMTKKLLVQDIGSFSCWETSGLSDAWFVERARVLEQIPARPFDK